MVLRWWNYLDIGLCAVILPAAFYDCIYKCIDAILNSQELTYKFPSSKAKLDVAA